MPKKKYKNKQSVRGASWQARDPFYEREAAQYDKPVPSREYILQIIQSADVPLSFAKLSRAMGVSDEQDLVAVDRRLQAMQRDGQILKNRRGNFVFVNEEDLVRGRVIAHSDGYGFLVPDEGGDDIYLSSKQMRSLLHGDRALVNVIGLDRRDRKEGAVVEVLERGNDAIVGRLHRQHGVTTVKPENKRIHQEILISDGKDGGAADGDVVVVTITKQPSAHNQPIGEISEVLGSHAQPGMEREIALRGHGLPYEWEATVLNEVAKFGDTVAKKDYKDKVDLRDSPLVTIDGADARDFDDAVFAKKTPKGWKLYVAIADVSAYVKRKSALDAEAYSRGTSVYFPREVIPMLPEKLSNGLCSLNPNVDRLAMVCEMQIDATGKISRSKFYEAVIKSHARLTYDQVYSMLTNESEPLRERYADVLPHLESLYSLYKAFRVKRENRGAIELETTETKFSYDENGKIASVEPLTRNEAHKVIEECMIAANVCAGKFIQKHKIPGLFRTHEGIKQDKLEDLRVFLGQFRLMLPGSKHILPKHYAEVLKRVVEMPECNLIQTVMMRSLKQAEYMPSNGGHFGLALDTYTHFTSPIRRYPDLMVHRAIKHILRNGTPKKYPYGDAEMENIGDHCSMTERRADEASRDVMLTLKCQFMADHVGNTYDGIVTGATSFGLFVELQDVFVEGLVHITALGDDYYTFDPVRHHLIGKRTKQKYQLADKLRVKVVRVDVDDKKVDLELEGQKTVRKSNDSRSKNDSRNKPAAKRRNRKKRGKK